MGQRRLTPPTHVEQGPVPEATGQLHSGRRENQGRLTDQSTPGLGHRSRVQVQVLLDVCQPPGVPLLPCSPAPSWHCALMLWKPKENALAFAHTVVPCPPEPPACCTAASQLCPHDIRHWGKRGKYGHPNLGLLLVRATGPWVSRDSHVLSHVNTRNTHLGTHATQHRNTWL